MRRNPQDAPRDRRVRHAQAPVSGRPPEELGSFRQRGKRLSFVHAGREMGSFGQLQSDPVRPPGPPGKMGSFSYSVLADG